MTDVITKIIDANPFVNGSIVTSVDKLGNFDTVAPAIDKNNFVQHSGIMQDRLDDYNYYTA
jgi:hypothetical protein